MRNRRKYALLLAIVLVAFGIVLALLPAHEPSYGGKRLSEWVVDLPPDDFLTGKSEAERAVRQIGTNAIPHLLKWMRYPSPLRVRLEAPVNKVLKKMNPAWKLSERNYLRAAGAMRALITMGPEARPAIGELCRLLNDPDTIYTVKAAAHALPYLGPDALPALVQALTNQQLAVRVAAAWNMAPLGTNAQSAVPLLIQCLTNQDIAVAAGAAQTLLACALPPDRLLPALTNCLTDSRPHIRAMAIGALRDYGRKAHSAVPMLIECLKDQDEIVAAIAAIALGEIKLEAATVVPGLTQSLKDPKTALRLHAAQGLGEFGPAARSAIPALKNALNDPEPRVRGNAANALRKIDPEALEKPVTR